MRLRDRLPRKRVDWNVGIGWTFFLIGLVAKENLPKNIGSLPTIQFPCAFFSSVFIPLGSLLALQALLGGQATTLSRFRNLLGYHIIGILFGILLLAGFFFVDFVLNEVLRLPMANFRDMVPRLIQAARTAPTEVQREKMAQSAYRIYGVTVPYRLDNGQVAYYLPTPDDWHAWLKMKDANNRTKLLVASITKVQGEYPYLVALFAATFTATFVAGWIWLALRPPSALVQNRQRVASP